jgi:hypothetical protein
MKKKCALSTAIPVSIPNSSALRASYRPPLDTRVRVLRVLVLSIVELAVTSIDISAARFGLQDPRYSACQLTSIFDLWEPVSRILIQYRPFNDVPSVFFPEAAFELQAGFDGAWNDVGHSEP